MDWEQLNSNYFHLLDLDECNSDEEVCFNGGRCTNTVGSYMCTCSERWTGPKCREVGTTAIFVAVDLCKKLDCINGLCVAKEKVFEVECKCYMGWSGDRCTIDVNECANAGCINGYCIDLVNGYKCECYIGFTGASCAIELSPCDYVSYDCGKGWCVAKGKIPFCLCLPGYTGLHCEQAINKCERDPCVNDGLCVVNEWMNQFECICGPNYSGLDCSIYNNPCIPSPCKNDASCTINETSPYGYTCLCKPGFYGGICEAIERSALLSKYILDTLCCLCTLCAD
ncbi:protein crumbs [Trichuris trichiura]|uniref:Protein crumbs n=1 Tax=Trichuris trichiura TaxID=36087 RepID=A0A077ZH42_TRITR|nr:protein crumbs [Trichuris trichiura]